MRVQAFMHATLLYAITQNAQGEIFEISKLLYKNKRLVIPSGLQNQKRFLCINQSITSPKQLPYNNEQHA